MRQIDIIVLKRLAEVVNVVPVIAKSDSLTLEERAIFKQRVSIVVTQSFLLAAVRHVYGTDTPVFTDCGGNTT